MSNRAWMPLHIDAYMGDTNHLSAAEHGAYLLLIMRYWKDGGLPADERLIQRYSRLSPEQWAESRDVLAAFFEEGWKHQRIDTELAKADEIIEKRRAAAEAKHMQRKTDASAVHVQSKSTDTHVPPLTDNISSLRSDEKARVRASFAEFWAAYPNKTGKPVAEKAYLKAIRNTSHETIMAGLARYIASKPADRSWLNPSTFLNQERWDDQPANVVPMARGSPVRGPEQLIDSLVNQMDQADANSTAEIEGYQAAALSLPGPQW